MRAPSAGGIALATLMECAGPRGRGGARLALRAPAARRRAGRRRTGHNGGDGWVLARALHRRSAGWVTARRPGAELRERMARLARPEGVREVAPTGPGPASRRGGCPARHRRARRPRGRGSVVDGSSTSRFRCWRSTGHRRGPLDRRRARDTRADLTDHLRRASAEATCWRATRWATSSWWTSGTRRRIRRGRRW